MILNPRKMVDFGAVKGLKDAKVQIQANGVDLRVAKLSRMKDGSATSVIDWDNSKRVYPEYEDIPLPAVVQPGTYLAQYAETVDIPLNVMAQVFMRSSLQRMGAYLFSSVYDSGYVGKGVGLLVLTKPIEILRDARIGQIVFHDADSAKAYDGIHKGEGVTKDIASGKPKPKPKQSVHEPFEMIAP